MQGNKVAIITGGSRGLGREIALAFGRRGWKVIVNYLSHHRNAEHTAEEIIRSGGEAVIFQVDVRNAEQVGAMMCEMLDRWGNIDVLVNNAGVTKDGLLVRMSEEDWDDVMNVNLKGAFNCIRAVSEIMMKSKGGHIINISSISGMQGREGQANYSASKAGLVGLTKAAARDLGRYNIKVNAVLPGYIGTEMGEKISDPIRDRIIKDNALGRANDPIEVAEFILHLTAMKNVSGQIFNLDSRNAI